MYLPSSSPNGVKSVIYFSDSASEGLSNSLTALPHATKVSLALFCERLLRLQLSHTSARPHRVTNTLRNRASCHIVP